ncbi:MAG: hypothetical protein GY801_30065 [bacterium]|nr:hypothetical protein [bacterium]
MCVAQGVRPGIRISDRLSPLRCGTPDPDFGKWSATVRDGSEPIYLKLAPLSDLITDANMKKQMIKA